MIRKLLTVIEETHREAEQDVRPPVRRAAAIAVVDNPFAGRFAQDLTELVELGAMLGDLLGRRAVAALGIAPGQADGYGTAAVVGEDGELEHAAAILHPKLAAPLRAAVGGGAAVVPSAAKRGGLGTAVDVPLGHKDDPAALRHLDSMEARVADAPGRGEIVVVVVVAEGGRPLPRLGGTEAEGTP